MFRQQNGLAHWILSERRGDVKIRSLASDCSALCISLVVLAGCTGSGSQSSIVAIPLNAPRIAPPPLVRQFGSTYKTVYSFKGKTDGYVPTGEILPLGEVLYGVTNAGGNDYGSLGTIYKVSEFGKETVLYRFRGGADGSNPTNAGLVAVKGSLYGTTGTGGSGCSGGCGTVFKTTTEGSEQVLYSFHGGSDG